MMSASELFHRTVDVGRRTTWRSRQVQPGQTAPLPDGTRQERSFAARLDPDVRDGFEPAVADALVRAADTVLDGEWDVLGVRRQDSADPDWFHDPVTGRRAPHDQLAFQIHHRDETATGNVKQVWEMSRHHHLTVLAAAWWLTRDKRYAETVDRQLRSWWAANPFLTGVHWTSGIEIGVRLISWTWIRRLLDDWPKVGDLFEHNDNAVRQIGWHQDFLLGFRSRGSSANNHVVAEAAGLLTAACAFPWFAKSETWRASAADLLEHELGANTFADGINKELASDYHRFALELGLVAAVEADACGHPLAETTWELLARMVDAAAAVIDVTGRPPRQGDGDEGRAIVVDDPAHDPWAIVLGSGAELLGTPRWWPATSVSIQAMLLGAIGATRRVSRITARPRHFPDAGLVVLRSRAEDGAEIWCRCDGGPHGFLSIAAHAHADALSVEVRHDGVDILADPGTYCYHGERAWRERFRSTAAHNTVEIGGVSQAEPGGPFLWTTDVATTTLACDVGEQVVQAWTAEHDGYHRLNSRAGHRRSVTLDSADRRVVIDDVISAVRPVAVALSWHLGPAIELELDEAGATISWQSAVDQRGGRLLLPHTLAWTAHRGELDPIVGWYAPRFGRRVPAWTIVGRGVADSSARLRTELVLP